MLRKRPHAGRVGAAFAAPVPLEQGVALLRAVADGEHCSAADAVAALLWRGVFATCGGNGGRRMFICRRYHVAS